MSRIKGKSLQSLTTSTSQITASVGEGSAPRGAKIEYEDRGNGNIGIITAATDEVMVQTFGTTNKDFASCLVGTLVATALDEFGRPAKSADPVNAALGMMAGMAPRDPVEAMLLQQMNLSHQMANRCARRSTGDLSLAEAQYWTNSALRWSRAFATHAETFKKLRSDGHQRVTVVNEHRHIHMTASQAQAAALAGDGMIEQIGEQPHGK